MKQKLLITGVSGLLGSNLAYLLKDNFDIVGLYNQNPIDIGGVQTFQCNILSSRDVSELIERIGPDVIFHSAAQANVDLCEDDPDAAYDINVNATKYLAEAADRIKAKFIYISTDLVYDGTKEIYNEEDEVNPVNVYGRTKLEGEKEALKISGALVLRINFFGWNIQPRQCIAEWGYKSLRTSTAIKGFTDVYFSALYTFDLPSIILKLLEKNASGIFNCGSSTSMSKYAFLCEIAKEIGCSTDLISPISVDDFEFKAKRSKNLRMDTGKLSALTGQVPEMRESLIRFLSDVEKNYAKNIGKLNVKNTRSVS